MDCESGSLRDSEPTSPGSPGSPDISFSKSNSTLPYNLTDELNAITMREESALDSCSCTLYVTIFTVSRFICYVTIIIDVSICFLILNLVLKLIYSNVIKIVIK